MKPGSLVETTNDWKEQRKYNLPVPEKGIIYTVKEIVRGFNREGKVAIGIELEEIPCPIIEGIRYSFQIEYFRELQPPMEINIEEFIHESLTI